MTTLRDPVKPAARYEAIVESKLARATGRIQKLHVTSALCVLAIVTLTYAGVMVICGLLGRAEPRLELPLLARQAVFAGYALGSAVYLLIYLVRPLRYRVNPYYAARQVERTVPGSKNSIVNWLDLRLRELPAWPAPP